MGRVPVVGTETREDVAEAATLVAVVALLEMEPVAGKGLDFKVEAVKSEMLALLL
jgi:hypothetical protein